MRRAVAEIISGEATRLDPQVPDEVRPLVGEINRLLDAQAKALARARSRAADLAHGLKTPLQVLSGDIRTLREKGDAKIADEIDRVAGSIRRHVDRELARARAASDSNTSTARSRAAEVAERVIEVVRRTPRGSTVAFVNDIPPELTLVVDETDLAEILGNLIENATRFARTRVHLAATESRETATLTVSDDGPGIPEAERLTALARGTRLDLRGDGDRPWARDRCRRRRGLRRKAGTGGRQARPPRRRRRCPSGAPALKQDRAASSDRWLFGLVAVGQRLQKGDDVVDLLIVQHRLARRACRRMAGPC